MSLTHSSVIARFINVSKPTHLISLSSSKTPFLKTYPILKFWFFNPETHPFRYKKFNHLFRISYFILSINNRLDIENPFHYLHTGQFDNN